MAPETILEFWRIKNSWGSTARRADAPATDAPDGYYDLEMSDLEGPSQADGSMLTPFGFVVLPPGF